MKMVKKILVGAVAVAMLSLVGCKFGGGEGDVDGGRYDCTMTVDGTEVTTAYRRYMKQISKTAAKVGHFETKLIVDDKTTGEDGKALVGNSVAGIAFNVHAYDYEGEDKVYSVAGEAVKDAEGNDVMIKNGDKVYEFVLIGFKPASKKAYIEHYVDIPKDILKENLDTNQKGIGNYYSIMPGETGANDCTEHLNDAGCPNDSDWFAVETGTYTSEDEDDPLNGCITLDISVVQPWATTEDAAHIYTITVGGKTAKYQEKNTKYIHERSDNTEDDSEQWAAAGAVSVYGNAYAGTKLVAKYVSKKPVSGEEFALYMDDAE